MSVIKVWTIQDQLFNGTAIACEAGEPIGISFILVRNQKKIQGFFAFYIYIYTIHIQNAFDDRREKHIVYLDIQCTERDRLKRIW